MLYKILAGTAVSYPAEFNLVLPTIDGKEANLPVSFKNISGLLRNKGIFIEGKFSAQADAYFHWLSFDAKQVELNLFTDETIETQAQYTDKRFPQGSMTNAEIAEYFERLKNVLNVQHPFDAGKEASEISQANTLMVSDCSNYPWNYGFFAIKNGRLLEKGQDDLSGKRWILAKNKDNEYFFRLLEVEQEDLSEIVWGLSLNPLIINGRILSSLTEHIPGTEETLLYNFRGGTAHIFREKISEDKGIDDEQDARVQDLISTSKHKVNAQLQLLLQEKHPEEKLERALYGHTVFALTKSNKFIVFKIFNRAKKDNGLYLEQVGPAVHALSKHFGEEVVFAGIGANGGDVRTYLGNTGYKNLSEDGNILQEKIAGPKARLKKVIWLTIEEL